MPATRAIMRWRWAPAGRKKSRNYLVLLGVPAAQLERTSWGKERPGVGRGRDYWCARSYAARR